VCVIKIEFGTYPKAFVVILCFNNNNLHQHGNSFPLQRTRGLMREREGVQVSPRHTVLSLTLRREWAGGRGGQM